MKVSIKKIIETICKEIALIAGTIITACGAVKAISKMFSSGHSRVHLRMYEIPVHVNVIGKFFTENCHFILIVIGILILIIELVKRKKRI